MTYLKGKIFAPASMDLDGGQEKDVREFEHVVA